MSDVALSNRFLDSLPPHERSLIIQAGAAVTQAPGEILYEVGRGFPALYFPFNSVISVTTQLMDGRIVESATIGNEGLAGLPYILGATRSQHRVIAQVGGEALRIPTVSWNRISDSVPVFRRRLGLFTDALMTAMSQSAACLAMHPAVERCARWLLMTADRTGAPVFRLTQEFLAAMLGTHRPTVTLAAGSLQSAGLIKYHRGQITITDRKGLEAASCECYGVVTRAFERFLASE